MRSRASAVCVLGLLIAIGVPVQALAAPNVHVRSRSTLTLDTVSDARSPTLRGQLIDDQGSPLGNRPIVIVVRTDSGANSRAEVITDAHGALAYVLGDIDARGVAFASFAGDADHDGSTTTLQLDFTTPAIDLQFVEPQTHEIDLDAPRVKVVVEARHAGAPLRIRLLDDARQPIADAPTDDTHRATFMLEPSTLGQPGPGVLLADVKPSEAQRGAETSIEIVRIKHSRITLAQVVDAPLQLAGWLRDQQDYALAEQAVTITMNDDVVATLMTDRDGRFVLDIAPEWPRGQSLSFVAKHESNVPWWIGDRSAVLSLELPTSQRPWWLLAAFAFATVITAIVAQRLAPKTRAVVTISKPGSTEKIELQATSAQRRESTLRAQVIDASTLNAVVNASVTVSASDRDVWSGVTDAEGRFATTDLPAGEVSLVVAAEGYVALRVAIILPHQGQWHGARIKLASLRAEALREYRRGVSTTVIAQEAVNELTAREAQQLYEQRAGSALGGLLRRLTDLFEVAYYGARQPSQTAIEDIGAAADDIAKVATKPAAESFDAERGRSL